MKTSEVAKRLGVCQKTVRRLANEEHIPCRIIPGRKRMYIFDESRIEEFLSNQNPKSEKYRINM
jgi:excisionase family DNA binding protein